MLSSAKIGRSSWRYYQATVAGGACEYYSEHGDSPGRWHGTGLAALGLQPGTVVAERELEALFGRALHPGTGVVLGQSWRDRSVTGYDLTFSAPKSVSTLWALGDADTIAAVEAAHTAAVHAGLEFLQARASASRRGRGGIEQITSSGYAAALFGHGTSRTGDPQLHTHALVVNKVRCADGVWRTLDGHEIYHHKKAAGALYQAALRAELTARLPVRFGPVSEHGQAEITGVPDQLLTAWSSRTAAVMSDAVPTIAAAEADLGRALTPTERARVIKTAVLATRPAKPTHHDDGVDRRRLWQSQAESLGWDRERLTSAVIAASAAVSPPVGEPVIDPATGVSAVSIDDQAVAVSVVHGLSTRQELLTDAVVAVGRTKAVWSRADLTVAIAARLHALGEPLPARGAEAVALVEELADQALAVPAAPEPSLDEPAHAPLPSAVGVVPLGTDPSSGCTARASDPRYASGELVGIEARIIERAVSGGFHPPAPLPAWVTDLLDHPDAAGAGPGLSGEQRRAALALIASRDLVTVMTAPAGAGKTTTMAAAIGVWRAAGMPVVLLAPSARAAAELADATTVATDGVGGAGGVGAVEGMTVARWLLTQARADTHPTHAGHLAAGAVVLVDEASMLTTSDLDQITARAHAARARIVLVGDRAQIGAVNAPGAMFDHLTDLMATRRIELTELHRFTHHWERTASLALRDGSPAAISAYLDHDRIHPATNAADAADAVFTHWHQHASAGVDVLMLAQSWTDVTALNTRARAAAIATGQVTGPDLLTLTSRSPSTRGHPEARSWRAGDLLLAKRNTGQISIAGRSLRNGDRFQVLTRTDDDEASGLLVRHVSSGHTTVLPADYLARYCEYGWAATIDGAQGATCDLAITLARSGLDREHLYVAMTRGRHENHIHTTTDLDTGDAGPHHDDPGRDAREGADGAGDYRRAVELLTRAAAHSGREPSAHALLTPAVTARRIHDWHAAQAGEPAPPSPDEHRRRLDRLAAARADHERARRHHDIAVEQHTATQNQLSRLPFWARRRRQDLTHALTNTHATLQGAARALDQAAGTVDDLTQLVAQDQSARDQQQAADLKARYQQWQDRTTLDYPDPVILPPPAAPTAAYPDIDPWPRPHPSATRDQGHDLIR